MGELKQTSRLTPCGYKLGELWESAPGSLRWKLLTLTLIASSHKGQRYVNLKAKYNGYKVKVLCQMLALREAAFHDLPKNTHT